MMDCHPIFLPHALVPGIDSRFSVTQPRIRLLLKMNECVFVSHNTYSVLSLEQFMAKSLHGFVTIDFPCLFFAVMNKMLSNHRQSQSKP